MQDDDRTEERLTRKHERMHGNSERLTAANRRAWTRGRYQPGIRSGERRAPFADPIEDDEQR